MSNQITITLEKSYTVNFNDEVSKNIASFAKLIDWLSTQEYNTLAIEFSVVNNETLAKKQQKICVRRINKLAKTLDMEVAFIENKVVKGHTFPCHFVSALV